LQVPPVLQPQMPRPGNASKQQFDGEVHWLSDEHNAPGPPPENPASEPPVPPSPNEDGHAVPMYWKHVPPPLPARQQYV
jgi:hypothetical protein